MTAHIERRLTPPQPARRGSAGKPTPLDLLHEGFHAIFLVASGAQPESAPDLREKMSAFLQEFETRARKAGIDPDDIDASKYAFCATVDEIVLRSRHAVRVEWECRPLQLGMFGDQLAGEHFFDRLERIRARGEAGLDALEVFHMCLLLGFQGKYLLGGAERLDYLMRRLGEEIDRMKGRAGGLAPHAARPDQVVNALSSDGTLWLACCAFAVLSMLAYAGFHASLGAAWAGADTELAAIKPLAPPPRLVISLP